MRKDKENKNQPDKFNPRDLDQSMKRIFTLRNVLAFFVMQKFRKRNLSWRGGFTALKARCGRFNRTYLNESKNQLYSVSDLVNLRPQDYGTVQQFVENVSAGHSKDDKEEAESKKKYIYNSIIIYTVYVLYITVINSVHNCTV